MLRQKGNVNKEAEDPRTYPYHSEGRLEHSRDSMDADVCLVQGRNIRLLEDFSASRKMAERDIDKRED